MKPLVKLYETLQTFHELIKCIRKRSPVVFIFVLSMNPNDRFNFTGRAGMNWKLKHKSGRSGWRMKRMKLNLCFVISSQTSGSKYKIKVTAVRTLSLELHVHSNYKTKSHSSTAFRLNNTLKRCGRILPRILQYCTLLVALSSRLHMPLLFGPIRARTGFTTRRAPALKQKVKEQI